jgi:hypothetical protein
LSNHITGLKGYIRVKAHYWTMNNDGDRIEHSIQETYSKKAIITNNTYKILLNNAILQGKWMHFKEFHRVKHSDTLWTYKIISSEIIYSSNPQISYNKRTSTVKANRLNKPTKYYVEERGLSAKSKSYIHKKNVTEGRKRADNISAYNTREYKRMSTEQRLRTRKENANKKRYRAKTKRVHIAPSVERNRRIKKLKNRR